MGGRRRIAQAVLFILALLLVSVLGPGVASGASCISTLAGDVCVAQCIGTQQQACGSDRACHRDVAAFLRRVARAEADSADCTDLLATIQQVCECGASPSGAFIE